MIQIRIRQPTPVLDEWLILNGYTTWAFITAWNPIGVLEHQLEENIQRNKDLLSKLQELDVTILPGWGIPDLPVWPPEASFLVLGITKAQATDISIHVNQRAFVFGRVSEKSALVVLDDNKHDAFHATTYTVSPINL